MFWGPRYRWLVGILKSNTLLGFSPSTHTDTPKGSKHFSIQMITLIFINPVFSNCHLILYHTILKSEYCTSCPSRGHIMQNTSKFNLKCPHCFKESQHHFKVKILFWDSRYSLTGYMVTVFCIFVSQGSFLCFRSVVRHGFKTANSQGDKLSVSLCHTIMLIPLSRVQAFLLFWK